MELLLNQLEALFGQPHNYVVDEDGCAYFTDSELYEEVVSSCCDVLITSNGQCDWYNIAILRDNGYRVFAGEKDSFGWLTGCIQKLNDPLRRTVIYG